MNPQSKWAVDVLMQAIRRVFPVSPRHVVSEEDYLAAKTRNESIDDVATLLCILGFFVGIIAPLVIRRDLNLWDVGVQFGLAVALPVFYILRKCRVEGNRLEVFFAFYSRRHGVDAKRIFTWLYAPLMAMGAICAFFAYAPKA